MSDKRDDEELWETERKKDTEGNKWKKDMEIRKAGQTISSRKIESTTFLSIDMDRIENDTSKNSTLPRERLYRVAT
jgi:hypothetical protein